MENEARVHLNLQKLGGVKVDYLTPLKQSRNAQNRKEYLKPVDWAQYIQKSLVNQIKPTKESVMLSHMSPITGEVKTENESSTKTKTPSKKKTKARCDWLKYEILDQCKKYINYLAKTQTMCFICETERTDRQGIKITKLFYVDHEGNTFSHI